MKNLETSVVAKTPFLHFVETEYEDQRGDIKKWAYVQRPNGRKAVVIATIVESFNQTLLGTQRIKRLAVIKEYRVPLNGYEYGFPAGLIDDGESPEDAITRELEEETGLKIKNILNVSPPVVSSAGISDEAVYLGYAIAEGEPNKDKLEASEDIETYLMTQSEVNDLLKRKDVTFGKSAYAIMRNFAKFGEI